MKKIWPSVKDSEDFVSEKFSTLEGFSAAVTLQAIERLAEVMENMG